MTEAEIMQRLDEIALRLMAIGAELTAAQTNGADTAELVAESAALNAEHAELWDLLPGREIDGGAA